LEGVCTLCLRVYIAGINTMTKNKLWKKGFIWLTLSHHSPSLKEARTGTKTGAEAEAMEGAAYWLAPRGLSSFQLAFFFLNCL
ncbi:hypothetical protein ACQP3F_25900, partial [Escherichia coli]